MLEEDLMLYLNFYFDFDQEKVNKWLRTPSSSLGDKSPEELAILGKEDKLRKFIINGLN